VQRLEAAGRGMRARSWLELVLAEIGALWRAPFFFVTVVVLLLKSYMAVLVINHPGHAAIVLARFDDYDTSIVIYLGFIAIPVALGFLLRGRGRLVYYLALDAAFSLLLIADLWYFRVYSTFLSVLLWQETPNLSGLWDSIVAMARPVDLLFLADLAILAPVVLLMRRPYGNARRSIALAVLVPAAAVVGLAIEHHRIDVTGTDPDRQFMETRWEARETIAFQSPLGFHVLDLYATLLHDRKLTLSPAQRHEIGAWFTANRERRPADRYHGMLKGRNLIVIQVESLEAFVIGRSVAGQEIAPTLDGLLANSFYFAGIWDQVNEGSSSDADLMTNTSVFPVRKGAAFFRFPANSYNSLPRILRGAGYRKTIAMHPDPAVYWNWKNALTAIGFDECLDISAFSTHEVLGLGLSDGDFLTQAATRLRAQPEPFYAFLVTLTSHAPFDLPAAYRELRLDKELGGSCLGKALQAFRYTDRQIGGFLERLRGGGLLDRSVVVIYGDHSSVHRFCTDEIAAMDGIEDWMRDPRRLVPLIIYAPGLAGERFAVTGGQVDIMPTILGLLGVDEEAVAGTAMGRNLLNTRRDLAVLTDGTVVGKDKDGPFAKTAVEGLAIADLAIRGDYFKSPTTAPR
jgi:lipoteichoic acid synthase